MNCLERSNAKDMVFPQSAQVLRKWCTPETILVITNLLDEDALLFHIVRQARQGAAKIILIQAGQRHSHPSSGSSCDGRQNRQSLSFRLAQLVLARMARKLRWIGLTCEPILNKTFSPSETKVLARLCAVDRIIVTAQGAQIGPDLSWKIFIDRLLSTSEVPVCIIGNQVAADSAGGQHSKSVSLALSLDSDSELALAFAARFAQEHQYQLTVMHVFSQEKTDGKEENRTPSWVASRLPAPILREAELFCPLHISVREGDPAREILRYDATTSQEFIILRSAGSAESSGSDEESIAHRIIREARCPVIILGRPATASVHENDQLTARSKLAVASTGTLEPRSGPVQGCA